MAKVGRPETTYKPEYIDEVDVYIESCKDEEKVFQNMSGKSNGYQRRVQVTLPTLEGFAKFLRNKYPGTKTTTTHIWNWEENHPEFLESTTRIRNEQAERLMNGTLTGDYEKSMAQLILRSQSRHYQPVEKNELTGKDGGAIKTESNLSDDQITQILDILNSGKE